MKEKKPTTLSSDIRGQHRTEIPVRKEINKVNPKIISVFVWKHILAKSAKKQNTDFSPNWWSTYFSSGKEAEAIGSCRKGSREKGTTQKKNSVSLHGVPLRLCWVLTFAYLEWNSMRLHKEPMRSCMTPRAHIRNVFELQSTRVESLFWSPMKISRDSKRIKH